MDDSCSFTIAVTKVPPELSIPTAPGTDYKKEVESLSGDLEYFVSPFLDQII